MSARNDDRLLSAWLHDIAPSREPEHLLGQVLARTARTRRRRAWQIPERWNPMSAISSRFAPTSPVPWRLIAVAAAVLLALAVGLALLASGAFRTLAPPYGPAANGAMYYSVGGDLYVRTTPTEPARVLLAGSPDDGAPVVSPDGSKVSFLRTASADTHELWVMNADGSGVHQLGVPAGKLGWFEWAPDGDAAVVLVDTDRTAMNIVPADGGPVARHDLGINLEQAYFLAPNGSRLGVLGSALDGTRGIYVVNRDGTGLHRLELDPGFQNDPFYADNRDSYFWTASWSPAGDQLLYSQLEPDPTSVAGPGFRNHLVKIDATGAVASETVIELDRSSDDEFDAHWLPRGDGFVYQLKEGLRNSILLARLNAGGAPTLTDLNIGAGDWIPTQVSPDGQQLLLSIPSATGGAPVVELLDLTTLTVTPLDVSDDATWQRLAPKS